MSFAVALIRAKVEAVLFLSQVIAAVDIAQQGQFFAGFLRVRLNFGHGIEQHILMRHHHHRHIAAKPFADLPRVISGSVHHILAADIAFMGVNNPIFAFAGDTRGRAKPFDLCAQSPRAFGKRLGQLCRINIAIVGIVKRAHKIMGFQKRIIVFDLISGQDFQIHPLGAPHPDHALKFLQPFGRMRQPDGPGDVIVHRIIDHLT